MPRIHPTAIVDPKAELAEDVVVGPGCVIEPDVTIGPGTVLGEYVVIRRHTTLGAGNRADAHCVLGGEPQDLKFDPATVSWLRIGDRNVFREHVTISRATGAGNVTAVGSDTYWMAGAHAGHNATVADNVILGNNAAVGGHATVGRRTILSAGVGVHQFCWIGEGCMTQGNGGFSMHLPPFTMTAGINQIIGLNRVGLKRNAEMSDADREQIKEAFGIVYRRGLPRTEALEEMDRHAEWGAAAGRFREFVRRVFEARPPYQRGLCPLRRQSH